MKSDPGPCLICDAPHCSCGGGPIEVVQLPARDAAAAVEVRPGVFVAATSSSIFAPAAAPLGDGSDGRPFSTATYRGTKKKR